LQTFVTNLGFGTLKNTGPDQENNVFAKINIQSGTTMLTAAQFDVLCSGGGVKNWANPWLGGSTADDKNDYYIHICYPYTYNTITPLPGLTAGTIAETKTMNNKALAYITKAISCPDGQVLQSMTGGSATCVARAPAGLSCASGQVVTAVTNGVPTCGAAPLPSYGVFGGMYTKKRRGGPLSAPFLGQPCARENPFTGGCSCPGWAPRAYGPFSMDSGDIYTTCGGPNGMCSTVTVMYDMYICIQ
jgi:hypothetical protein